MCLSGQCHSNSSHILYIYLKQHEHAPVTAGHSGQHKTDTGPAVFMHQNAKRWTKINDTFGRSE